MVVHCQQIIGTSRRSFVLIHIDHCKQISAGSSIIALFSIGTQLLFINNQFQSVYRTNIIAWMFHIRPRLLPIFPVLVFLAIISSSANGQQKSPEVVAKWHRFVESLNARQRSEFDQLHQEAGRLDPIELAKRTQKFVASLNGDQKRNYQEIQQRGGGGSSSGGNGGIPTGSGDDERERQRNQRPSQVPSGSGAGSGGLSQQGFDRWINNPELADSTRNSLKKIKEIFSGQEMDPIQKCEKIQRILRGIGTADKKRMQMPTQLYTFDCAHDGQSGAENLLAAALTRGGPNGGK